MAIKDAFLEQDKFKDDVRKKGEEFLKYIDKHGEKAIVLAGRPYHLDKEVNHGIDNSLGLAVLTEDLSKLESNLRVVNQWTYHYRVYHAADVVSRYNNLELVNLNSFGCGLDAIVTDQAEEILRRNNKLYTTIKIDEINNLGAAKIRIRSLIASMNKRVSDNSYVPYTYTKNYFKESDRRYTLLFPDMSEFHMPLFEALLQSEGYNVVYLRDSDVESVNTGLRYVNNDAYYSAIIVIGQLISSLKSGKYDLENTSVIITQTGGECRATNYIGLIRKVLVDAGFSNVSILSFNFSGLEKQQAFHINLSMAKKALEAVVYGDLLMKLLLATRPYEVKKGRSMEVYEKWNNKCCESVKNGRFSEFKDNIKNIVSDFKKIRTKKDEKPKVGIVGEILINYHTFGNDNLVLKLENEYAEVFAPELMGFVKYCCINAISKSDLLKTL